MTNLPKLEAVAVSQDRTLIIRQMWPDGDILPEAHCGKLLTWQGVMDQVNGTDGAVEIGSVVTAKIFTDPDPDDLTERCAHLWLADNPDAYTNRDGLVIDDISHFPPFVVEAIGEDMLFSMSRETVRDAACDARSLRLDHAA